MVAVSAGAGWAQTGASRGGSVPKLRIAFGKRVARFLSREHPAQRMSPQHFVRLRTAPVPIGRPIVRAHHAQPCRLALPPELRIARPSRIAGPEPCLRSALALPRIQHPAPRLGFGSFPTRGMADRFAGAQRIPADVARPPADRRRKVALRVAKDCREIETKRQRDGAIRSARNEHLINRRGVRVGAGSTGARHPVRLHRNETGSIRGGRRRGCPPYYAPPPVPSSGKGGGLSVGYGGSAAAHRWQLPAPRRAPRGARRPATASAKAAPRQRQGSAVYHARRQPSRSSSMMLRVEQSPALAHPASRCGGRAVSNSSCERRGSPH